MSSATPNHSDQADGIPDFGTDEMAKLLWLTEKPGRAFLYLGKVSESISRLFGQAESAAQRDSLLHMFSTTMAMVDEMLSKTKPGMLEEFRAANYKSLKTYWIQESLVNENVDGKTLVAVSRREQARQRMAANCEPILPGTAPLPSVSEQDLAVLNAAIDHERREASAGRAPTRTQTVLLYPVPGLPKKVGVSKVDPPVEGGAFCLDFSVPLQLTRRFFGKRTRRIGAPVELQAPVIHQGQRASDQSRFMITVDSRDPRFSEIRTLWKKRYPTSPTPPATAVSGIKVLVDFYTQFPDD